MTRHGRESSRPSRSNLNLGVREDGDNVPAITTFEPERPDDRASYQTILNPVKAGKICQVAPSFIEEVLVRDPQANAEIVGIARQRDGEYFGESVTEIVNENKKSLQPGELIAIHTFHPVNDERISSEGIKSRRQLGAEKRTQSDIRYESGYFHGNIYEFERSQIGYMSYSITAYAVCICQVDATFWGSTHIAGALTRGKVSAQEYRTYGVTEYSKILGCPEDDMPVTDKGNFLPYKVEVGGQLDDNFKEFESKGHDL